MPTPVAALVWSSVLLTGVGITGASIVAIVLGLGMVAPLRISRPGAGGLTLFALWPIGLLVAYLAQRLTTRQRSNRRSGWASHCTVQELFTAEGARQARFRVATP